MLDDVTTALTTGLAELTTQIPLVIAIAIPIAVVFWAAPKLIGLVRKVGK